jgi:hypothetical protein
MADISPLDIRNYEATLRHLSQQGESRLRNWCMERNAPKMHLWDTIAQQSVSQKTNGTRTATPNNASTLARRRSTPTTWHVGDTLEPESIAMVLNDPTSSIAIAMSNAIRRKYDDLIISAALGATEAEDGTSTGFPVGQGLGGATQAFDFAFITSVQEKFMTAEIFPEEEKVFVIRPNGAKKLLNLTQATSSDYVNAKALATTGYVEKWMGFTWVVSNLLPNVTGLQYYYLAMTRRAIGLHVTKDIWVRIAEDPTYSFDVRVYAAFTAGAVRVEDAHAIRCHVLES